MVCASRFAPWAVRFTASRPATVAFTPIQTVEVTTYQTCVQDSDFAWSPFTSQSAQAWPRIWAASAVVVTVLPDTWAPCPTVTVVSITAATSAFTDAPAATAPKSWLTNAV